jgi:hypothetical protein
MHPVMTLLDVAHPPRPAARVEEELLDVWQRVRNSPSLRLIKVVHGYGSSGKGGTGRETVRNWAFRNRRRLRSVIEGEHYAIGDAATEDLLGEVGPLGDADLNAGNRGITLLWVR